MTLAVPIFCLSNTSHHPISSDFVNRNQVAKFPDKSVEYSYKLTAKWWRNLRKMYINSYNMLDLKNVLELPSAEYT